MMCTLFRLHIRIWRCRPWFGSAWSASKRPGLAVRYSMVTKMHLKAELQARSMQQEGPATGQLNKVFGGFPRSCSNVLCWYTRSSLHYMLHTQVANNNFRISAQMQPSQRYKNLVTICCRTIQFANSSR